MNSLFPYPVLAAWKILRSLSQPAKCSTNCAKKSTAPSKPNIRPALSRISNRGSKHETRRSLHHFLRSAVWVVDTSRKVEDMASIPVSYPVGCGGIALRRISGPHLLDRNSRQHAARFDRLRYLGSTRDDPRPWGGQQQIPRRNDGGPAGEPAKSAEHLLVAACAALVWPESECDSVRGHHGIAALRHSRDGRWPQTDAEDFRPSWTQSRSERIQVVLV